MTASRRTSSTSTAMWSLRLGMDLQASISQMPGSTAKIGHPELAVAQLAVYHVLILDLLGAAGGGGGRGDDGEELGEPTGAVVEVGVNILADGVS